MGSSEGWTLSTTFCTVLLLSIPLYDSSTKKCLMSLVTWCSCYKQLLPVCDVSHATACTAMTWENSCPNLRHTDSLFLRQTRVQFSAKQAYHCFSKTVSCIMDINIAHVPPFPQPRIFQNCIFVGYLHVRVFPTGANHFCQCYWADNLTPSYQHTWPSSSWLPNSSLHTLALTCYTSMHGGNNDTDRGNKHIDDSGMQIKPCCLPAIIRRVNKSMQLIVKKKTIIITVYEQSLLFAL